MALVRMLGAVWGIRSADDAGYQSWQTFYCTLLLVNILTPIPCSLCLVVRTGKRDEQTTVLVCPPEGRQETRRLARHALISSIHLRERIHATVR